MILYFRKNRNAICSLWEGEGIRYSVSQIMASILFPLLAFVGFLAVCYFAERYFLEELGALAFLLVLSIFLYHAQPSQEWLDELRKHMPPEDFMRGGMKK